MAIRSLKTGQFSRSMLVGNPMKSPIAGYTAWYDASDTSTITLSGSNVTQWNDKSGNAYHLSQATTSRQPRSGINTVNGRNAITYDGTDDRLQASTASNWTFLHHTATHTFMVFYTNTAAASQRLMETSTDGEFRGIMYTIDTNDTVYAECDTGNVSNRPYQMSTTLTVPQPGASYWTFASDPGNATAANRIKIRKNGVAAGGTNTNTATPSTSVASYPLTVGGWAKPDSYSLNGYMCEIIIYPSILSDSDRNTVESYLATKWGI